MGAAASERERPRRDERGDPAVARAYLVCAECRYARPDATQPRVLCTRAGSRQEGRLVFSGQPACDAVELRRGDERSLAWCSLRAISTCLRLGRFRPDLY